MMGGNGQLSVPPGFRFHPTDEELLYYYLRKKVSYEPIDLDVIREVDLNKLEPWDLKDKCSIGSGPQNEWYFFSHKDKKYPTGTRTNRATAAGFWKATGRDKAIHHTDSKRIGMRKTLVFYTGRAPNGHKTDWIMHEYRLNDDVITSTADIQLEEGWVICRVFKKKPHARGYHTDQSDAATAPLPPPNPALLCDAYDHIHSMHLPQLLSPDMLNISPSLILPTPTLDDSHNPLRLGSSGAGPSGTGALIVQPNGDNWSFLDKLLATHQSTMDQSMGGKSGGNYQLVPPRFPCVPYHGFGQDFARYPK